MPLSIPVLSAVALALLLPSHASVTGTSPADGETLTGQPGAIAVTASEAILAVPGSEGTNALRVTDAEGRFYGDGCVVVDGASLSMQAMLGAPGDYTVTYQLVSADGHPIDGTFSFAYAPAAAEAGAEGLAEAPVCGAATAPAASAEAGPSPDAATPTADASAQPATPATADADPAPEPAATDGVEGGAFPFLAVGVLALLGVLAVIAWTVRRGSRGRLGD